MSWLNNIQVSYYYTHSDNIGRPATYAEVLNPDSDDFETIKTLRSLSRDWDDFEVLKKQLKALLSCYTPAALLATKAKGKLQEISRSGMMQLDFDYSDICEYDIEELKRCVFSLPFIAYCGLSCRGDGFYALAMIAEPHRLGEYAEHCFGVFESFGIKLDTSKGKKVENLRYVSYDSNALIRLDPVPLKIKEKPKIIKQKREYASVSTNLSGKARLIEASLEKIRNAQIGQRWPTVQNVAYTLGGIGDRNLLAVIKKQIENTNSFTGLEQKYFECAEVCFEAGLSNPLPEKQRL